MLFSIEWMMMDNPEFIWGTYRFRIDLLLGEKGGTYVS